MQDLRTLLSSFLVCSCVSEILQELSQPPLFHYDPTALFCIGRFPPASHIAFPPLVQPRPVRHCCGIFQLFLSAVPLREQLNKSHVPAVSVEGSACPLIPRPPGQEEWECAEPLKSRAAARREGEWQG